MCCEFLRIIKCGVFLQTLVFINSFLSLNDPNQVAVIGMTSTSR